MSSSLQSPRSWLQASPVLATFDAPHVSIVLIEPTLAEATRLRELFGDPTANPHYDGRRK
jgi:hypothetical protein